MTMPHIDECMHGNKAIIIHLLDSGKKIEICGCMIYLTVKKHRDSRGAGSLFAEISSYSGPYGPHLLPRRTDGSMAQ